MIFCMVRAAYFMPSFGVQYLQDNYGRDAMEEYLRTAGLAVYKPLILSLIHI